MEQAITPSTDDPIIPLDMDEQLEVDAISQAEKDDEELASLAASRAWTKIAKQMQTDVDSLKTGAAININSETPLEEIGRKYVVASAVASHLQTYLDMVNGAATRVAERAKNAQRLKSAQSKSTTPATTG